MNLAMHRFLLRVAMGDAAARPFALRSVRHS
jgi:hypothetical protein